jgi:hypothetical protein
MKRRRPPLQRLSDRYVMHGRSAGISRNEMATEVVINIFGCLINQEREIVLPHLICWTKMLLDRAGK